MQWGVCWGHASHGLCFGHALSFLLISGKDEDSMSMLAFTDRANWSGDFPDLFIWRAWTCSHCFICENHKWTERECNLLHPAFTKLVYFSTYMEILSFTEDVREENRIPPPFIANPPHFIALPYSVSPSLHSLIAVPPLVQFVLFTDYITCDKDCYYQQKPLYLVMWKPISFVANL